METEDRETHFDVMFGFIINGYKKEKCTSGSEKIQNLYKWYCDTSDLLEDAFIRNDFFFNI